MSSLTLASWHLWSGAPKKPHITSCTCACPSQHLSHLPVRLQAQFTDMSPCRLTLSSQQSAEKQICVPVAVVRWRPSAYLCWWAPPSRLRSPLIQHLLRPADLDLSCRPWKSEATANDGALDQEPRQAENEGMYRGEDSELPAILVVPRGPSTTTHSRNGPHTSSVNITRKLMRGRERREGRGEDLGGHCPCCVVRGHWSLWVWDGNCAAGVMILACSEILDQFPICKKCGRFRVKTQWMLSWGFVVC